MVGLWFILCFFFGCLKKFQLAVLKLKIQNFHLWSFVLEAKSLINIRDPDKASRQKALDCKWTDMEAFQNENHDDDNIIMSTNIYIYTYIYIYLEPHFQPFINRCLVISNHFLCKDWESSNWNNHLYIYKRHEFSTFLCTTFLTRSSEPTRGLEAGNCGSCKSSSSCTWSLGQKAMKLWGRWWSIDLWYQNRTFTT